MAVLQSKTHLGKVVKDLILGEVVIVSHSLLNYLAQVTTVCVLHNDVQVKILVFENIMESDNVRMVEDLQNSGFISSYRPLFSRHILQVDSLDRILFRCEARPS